MCLDMGNEGFISCGVDGLVVSWKVSTFMYCLYTVMGVHGVNNRHGDTVQKKFKRNSDTALFKLKIHTS